VKYGVLLAKVLISGLALREIFAMDILLRVGMCDRVGVL
jgi:hypothetical protein